MNIFNNNSQEMPESKNQEINNNDSIEEKLNDVFGDLKLNEEQIKRIKICLEKTIKENSDNSIKITLKKFKKIISNSNNFEEGIKKIEDEINDLNNKKINTTKFNDLIKEENNQNIVEMAEEFGNTFGISLANNLITNGTGHWVERTCNQCIESLKKVYEKLDKRYTNFNQEKIDQEKASLSEDTKKKLAENNINEDEYIKYTISRKIINEEGQNDNTPETRDFLKNLKNLEDNLGIRRETVQGLPLSTDRTTFENNPQLRAFKDNDPEIAKLGKKSYIGTERIELDNKKPEELKATIAPYQKMEEIYKDHKDFPKDQKFQDISKKINEGNFTELKQEEVDYYTSSLDKLNGWITNYIKASAAQAPLTGILRYLDSYTGLSRESIQDQFGASNKEYITMQDETMRINGVIGGNPLSFYYDVKDGQTKISCDDVLHVENDIFQIYNGQGEYPKSDLRINMPSIKDVVDNLQKIDQKAYTELLQQANNLKEFQRSIADLINNQIKETFPDNDEIKTRMGRFTEKNLAAQAFDSALIGRTEYKNKINEKKENGLTPIKKVLLLVDNTTEKSTATELIEFRGAMKKLEGLLGKSQEEINKIKDPVLKDNLLKLKKGKENQNYEEWEKSITTFFTLFERKDPADPEFKIDIDDFSTFIDLGTKDEETKKSTLESFTPEFLKAYNKLNPETKKIKEQGKTIKERSEAEHEKESEEADEELTAKLEMRESTTEISFG